MPHYIIIRIIIIPIIINHHHTHHHLDCYDHSVATIKGLRGSPSADIRVSGDTSHTHFWKETRRGEDVIWLTHPQIGSYKSYKLTKHPVLKETRRGEEVITWSDLKQVLTGPMSSWWTYCNTIKSNQYFISHHITTLNSINDMSNRVLIVSHQICWCVFVSLSHCQVAKNRLRCKHWTPHKWPSSPNSDKNFSKKTVSVKGDLIYLLQDLE